MYVDVVGCFSRKKSNLSHMITQYFAGIENDVCQNLDDPPTVGTDPRAITAIIALD